MADIVTLYHLQSDYRGGLTLETLEVTEHPKQYRQEHIGLRGKRKYYVIDKDDPYYDTDPVKLLDRESSRYMVLAEGLREQAARHEDKAIRVAEMRRKLEAERG